MSKLVIAIEPNGRPPARNVVFLIMRDANAAAGFVGESAEYCATLRDSQNEIHGGVVAEAVWNWLYVATLVVKPEWRRRNYGSALLDGSELWARRLGCRGAWLTTTSFQAPAFYERHGYTIFGTLPSSPAGETTYFFRKIF